METKAMLLSFWDAEQQETLKMDLWVKDMPYGSDATFFSSNIDVFERYYFRATQDEKMTATMRDFCDFFAEKLSFKEKLSSVDSFFRL